MRRIVATFDDEDDAAAARRALRDADLKPETPAIDNPFFDPSADLPERRGLLWGGLLGGLLGAVLLFAVNQNLLWIPRFSPIMTAGRYVLLFLGFGLGATVGGFVGGVLGTAQRVPERDRPRVAVTVPDGRVRPTTGLLRRHGATDVADAVTYHEHPLETQSRDAETNDD